MLKLRTKKTDYSLDIPGLLGTLSLTAGIIGVMMHAALAGGGGYQKAPGGAFQPVGCEAQTPYGEPAVPGNINKVCHQNYASYYSLDWKIPRLVVYRLTGEHTFGCLPRKGNFHAEVQIPAGHQQMPQGYNLSQWDLGHFAPDQDMAWDQTALYDSFSTANVAPQKPGMNRQGWERGEESVRAWAMERGEVLVYVGDIVDPNPDHMGNGIAIPRAFFKVVVDLKTNEFIAYEMNNVDTPKQDMSAFITSVQKVEQDSGITIPLPEGADKSKNVALWHTASSDWRKRHKEICKGNAAWKLGDPPIVREDLKRSP